MAERIGNRRTLNFTTIYKKITEQGKTIPEMAEVYSMAEDDFVKEMRMGLGPKLFPNAEKASQRNEKARERLKKTAKKKREASRIIRDSNEIDGGAVSVIDEQSPKVREKELKVKKMMEKLDSQEKELFELQELMEKEIISINEAEDKVAEAKRAVTLAEKKLRKAEESLACLQVYYEEHQDEYDQRLQKVRETSLELEKLKKSIIYLIAPGYKEKLPDYGVFISTTKIDGVDVKLQMGDVLVNDPTYESVVESGYNELKEFNDALEFAKLCLLYETSSNADAIILVDDERMLKVLQYQGVMVSN